MAVVTSNLINDQYERALARAQAQNLRVRKMVFGKDEIVAEIVNPANEAGTYYTVRMPRGANVSTCNCQAGQASTYCKHRALARHEAITRLQARDAKRAERVKQVAPKPAATGRPLIDSEKSGADFDKLMAPFHEIAAFNAAHGFGSGRWH